jgi:beta-ketoacyl-acyl-carrier-protein synthase II
MIDNIAPSIRKERATRRRVVITGAGALSPVGNSAPETWTSFVAGKSGAARVASFDASPYQAKIACEIKDFDPAKHIDAKEARRMARCSQLAIVAAREAVADAGLDFSHEDRERIGVAMGTGMGGIDILLEPIGRFATQSGVRVTPHQALEALSNMPGFHVSLDHGCLGPLTTIITACAAGTQAIGEGLQWIRRGAVDVALAGGTEAQVNPLFFAGFSALRVLSTQNEEPERAAKPFDAERDGFVIGEAACVLVLEELERAKARGAKIYAEVLGEAVSADAYHIAQPEATGLGPARCMKWALQDAGIAPQAIQYINAHGSGTAQNDPAETAALKRVFGEHAYRVPISSTKSMIGHCFGGGGALEAFATAMSICSGVIHPTINLTHPDPACDLDYVPNRARHCNVDVAMTNSFGLGGQNAVLVLGKYSD